MVLSRFGAKLNSEWQSLTGYLSIRFICTLNRLLDFIINVIKYLKKCFNFTKLTALAS